MTMNLLFDLDGTLTDAYDGITNSISHALSMLGRVSPPKEALRWCIGPPLKKSFAKLLGSDDVSLADTALSYYRERYSSVGLYENSVYDGIPELCRSLQDKGHTLFVATSKPTIYAVRIDEHFGLLQFFNNIYGSELDGVRNEKPDLVCHILKSESISTSTTFMIGDREQDMIGATANGIPGIGVLWGYGSREELVSSGASAYVEQPIDIMVAIDGMFRNKSSQTWYAEGGK